MSSIRSAGAERQMAAMPPESGEGLGLRAAGRFVHRWPVLLLVPVALCALFIAGCASSNRSSNAKPIARAVSSTVPAIRVGDGTASGTPSPAAGGPSYKEAADYLAAGKIERAIEVFRQLVDRDPGNARQRVEFARLLITAGKLDEAQKVLDPVLTESPNDLRGLYDMALLEDARGNLEEERRYLDKILSLEPNNSDANASIGQLELASDNMSKASAAFQKSLAADPNNVTALIGQGNVLLQQDNAKEALKLFDHAIKLEPNLSFAYSDRAQARAALNDYRGAEADLTKAIELDPNYYWHYIDRGRLRLTTGIDRSGALADFKKAAELKPNYFLAYVYLAGMYDHAKDYPEAAKAYAKLLELRPDYVFAYRPYALLTFMEKKWNTAREYFKKAYHTDPADPGTEMFVVLTYLEENNAVEAAGYLRQMVAELPHNGLFFALAKMYLDPSYEHEFLGRLNEEKNPDVRTRMMFYLGFFYALHDRKNLAEQYLLDVDSHPVEGMYEYPIGKWELENLRR